MFWIRHRRLASGLKTCSDVSLTRCGVHLTTVVSHQQEELELLQSVKQLAIDTRCETGHQLIANTHHHPTR
jgi:hypothetical protein